MEFSFEMPLWLLDFIENNPISVVIWAALGVPFFALAVAFVLSVVYKVTKLQFIKTFTQALCSALFITWITGFILCVILLFMEISGIKLLLIWGALYVCFQLFSVVNYNMIDRFIKSQIKQ